MLTWIVQKNVQDIDTAINVSVHASSFQANRKSIPMRRKRARKFKRPRIVFTVHKNTHTFSSATLLREFQVHYYFVIQANI